MKTKIHHLFLALGLFVGANRASAQGTAFTYQGQLQDNGSAASGNYDFTFRLFDNSSTNTGQIGSTLTNLEVGVANGQFTVTLDFGGVFTGNDTWLAVSVRTNGGASYVGLTPLELLTPTPNAIFAETASNLSGTLSSAQISGTLANGQLANDSLMVNAGTGLSGGGAVTLGGSTTLNNTGVLSVTGNADITATTTTGAVTLGSTATSLDAASTIVKRDASGNFMAGTITANFQSDSSGDFVAGAGNSATGGSASVGGGNDNRAGGQWATVSGGFGNSAVTQGSVGGGYGNDVSEQFGTIGGGFLNTAGMEATVAGGFENNAIAAGSFVGGGGYDGSAFAGNVASGAAATVAGGLGNHANNGYAVVTGGVSNSATGAGAFVGGGGWDGSDFKGNTASGQAATVGGGVGNAASAMYTTVGGGGGNTAAGSEGATVSGGFDNSNHGYGATIGGGSFNTIDFTASSATVSGGNYNTCFGAYAAIPGGYNNTASGEYSFAAGQEANANDQGAFVWADSQAGAFDSTGNDQFCIRAEGGVQLDPTTSIYFGTQTRQMLNLYSSTYGIGVQNDDEYFRTADEFYWYIGGTHTNLFGDPGGGTQLMRLGSSGSLIVTGSVTAQGVVLSSDRNKKENFKAVDAQAVLAKVAAMPVTEWQFKTEPGERHLGPMAQDFHAAFGLGTDDKHIGVVDEGGVALAAIKGLNEKVNEKESEIRDLKRQNDSLVERLNALEATMKQLAAQK